jgi:NO-binding membrane sensor protein with MHYT domain
VLSLLVAIAVVGVGIFTVGYSQSSKGALLLGGLGTGVGVAAMHYLGMAALHVHGHVGYDIKLVALSVVIAVVAATAALWAALNVRSTGALWIAAPVMGLAVSSMHYTGMAAVRIHLVPSPSVLSGASAMEFIFPLAVGLGSLLFLTVAFVSLSPTVHEWDVSPVELSS